LSDPNRKPASWIIDHENNLIHEDDDRHTIVCHFGGSLKNPDVLVDAYLIHAAPDLLAVCLKLRDYALSGAPFAYPLGALQELIDVIAKAEGGTP
jgi:hypothetical protein